MSVSVGLALCAHRLFMTCWSLGARIHPRQARQVCYKQRNAQFEKRQGGFEGGTLTYFDSLRFHSILSDNPIIYDNHLSSTACAVFFCHLSLDGKCCYSACRP